MGGSSIPLEPAAVVAYYQKMSKVHKVGNGLSLEVTDRDAMVAHIQEVLAQVPADFSWDSIKTYSLEEQKEFWTLREFLFAQILLLVISEVQDGVSSRPPPDGFFVSDHEFLLFGSTKPTSDIDVTVAGPRASYVIALMEDAWLAVTGEPSSRWEIEYYGDLLMFLDEKDEPAFLNSREFMSAADRILPYVGASILRNTYTLDFPLLNEFIVAHPEIPQLQGQRWKVQAEILIHKVNALDYNEKREAYYNYLDIAEELNLRHGANSPTYQNNLQMYLALCQANLYRTENYVLPSTVIHVVREIQGGSPKPTRPNVTCKPYHVRLATCALGPFTYLCSAMEQIGYWERFSSDPAKVQKYKERFENAIAHYGELQKGGVRRRCKRPIKTRRQKNSKKTRRR